MGLDLHDKVRGLGGPAIDMCSRVGKKPVGLGAGDYGRVIGVGGQHAFRRVCVGVLDHFEERIFARYTIQGPAGVEYFVSAVF